MFGSFRLERPGGDRCSDHRNTGRSKAAIKRDEDRKKIWTRRSKGGCLTCRARRVKCGEERPQCVRCVTGRHRCRGYERDVVAEESPEASPEESPVDDPKDVTELPDYLGPRFTVIQQRRAAKVSDLLLRRQHLSVEVDPPYWDYLESLRFYYRSLRPYAPKQFGLVRGPQFTDGVHPANFVGRTLASYIKIQSLQLGRLLRPNKDPAFKTLWINYAKSMVQLADLVKFFIAGGTLNGHNYIYACFYTLFRLSLPLHWMRWHCHVKGCLAYLQKIGGPMAMFQADERFVRPIGFTRLISEVIAYSTTTPARMQITEYNDFLDRDMRTILCGEYDCDLPAPLDLRIAIWHINRLRHEASLGYPLEVLTPRVYAQMEEIDDACVEVWVNKNALYGLEHTLAIARIFRVAVRLFALLTLPRESVSSWAASATHHVRVPDLDPYNGLRLSQRKELVERLRDLFPRLDYQPNLRWPMVVAGVALVDGSAEDKDFVSESLLTIWKHPVVACGPIQCRLLLHQFWASGKTEWEDCFIHPVSC